MNAKLKVLLASFAAACSASASAGVWRPAERWRGFNLQDVHWKFGRVEFSEDDFAFMKEFGFNFARLPLSYRRWPKNPDDWTSIDPS